MGKEDNVRRSDRGRAGRHDGGGTNTRGVHLMRLLLPDF